MAPQLTWEGYNRIVEKTILDEIEDPSKTVFQKLSDFNRGQWEITSDFEGKNPSLLTISASLICWQQLKQYGAEEYLKSIYGDLLIEPVNGYNVSLRIECKGYSGNKNEIALKIAQLQRNMLIAPGIKLIDEIKSGKAEDKLIQIDYRPGESMWYKTNGDRLTVIFSVHFDDPDDDVFGRVFIGEFQKSQAGCPACDVIIRKGANPPGELKNVKGLNADNCYVSFVIEKRYMDKKERLLEVLTQYSNYIQYHVKCSKAFLHIRMRNKVSAMQLVLNRAKQEKPVEKKTMSGRTFKK